MTKAAALYSFWASFGIPTYDESSVPTGDDAPKFPYITYQVVTDSIGSEVAMVASVWDHSTSWVKINAIVQTISEALSGGKIIPCDGGALWLKRGTPFAQSMGDPSDDKIRRKLINVSAEYITLI